MADINDIPRLSDYPARAAAAPPPLLSVVTTVRNGVQTLPHTLESIRAQNFLGLEYIVADAGSTDGTLDIIRANGDIVSHWQSEPDEGISDGFNKGIALSRGKYVTILNADDWLSPGQLAFGVETLEQTGADFVFGDLMYHGADGLPLYLIAGETDYTRRIGHVMPALNHPTVILRRDAYERFGLFDTTLRLAMDYDLLLRLHRGGCRGVHDGRMIGHMTLDGVSDTQSRKGLAEVRDISIRHGASAPAAWMRYLFRIVKGDTRRLLDRILHPALAKRIRHRINRQFIGLER